MSALKCFLRNLGLTNMIGYWVSNFGSKFLWQRQNSAINITTYQEGANNRCWLPLDKFQELPLIDGVRFDNFRPIINDEFIPHNTIWYTFCVCMDPVSVSIVIRDISKLGEIHILHMHGPSKCDQRYIQASWVCYLSYAHRAASP